MFTYKETGSPSRLDVQRERPGDRPAFASTEVAIIRDGQVLARLFPLSKPLPIEFPGAQRVYLRRGSSPCDEAKYYRVIKVDPNATPLRIGSQSACNQDLCDQPPARSLRRIGSPTAPSSPEKIDEFAGKESQVVEVRTRLFSSDLGGDRSQLRKERFPSDTEGVATIHSER